MKATLVASLLCLALWIGFGFVRPIGLGVVNLLWAAGCVLWIRWYAVQTKLSEA